MKGKFEFIFIVCLLAGVTFFVSSCDIDDNYYGTGWGDIYIQGGTKLPFWASVRGYVDGIETIDLGETDGIKIMQNIRQGNSYEDWFPIEYIILVKTYDAFVSILNPVCNHNQPCIHDSKDYSENEPFLELFTANFFETNDLVIASMIMGANTIGLNVNKKKAVSKSVPPSLGLSIVETCSGRAWHAVPSIAIPVLLAIDISKDIDPFEVKISINSKYIGRR